MANSFPVIFAGNTLLMDSRAALYWEAENTLIVSDLHLEKGSFLARSSCPLPLYDTEDTITRLEYIINYYSPSRVIALGDSFHDANALSRMSLSCIDRLNRLISRTDDWIWIIGNHDPVIPETVYGRHALSVSFSNIYFCHEPAETTLAQIAGHYHPKIKYRLKANHPVTGKCFIAGKKLIIMPSFGTFTGGLHHNHPVIQKLFPHKDAMHYLLFKEQVFAVAE